MYRLLVPYSDNLELAEKILHLYNGYLMASGKQSSVIERRFIPLLSYYMVFGYSMDARRKYCLATGCSEQYARVIDVALKDKGHLIDTGKNYKSRRLSMELDEIRKISILGSSDKSAIVSLFYR